MLSFILASAIACVDTPKPVKHKRRHKAHTVLPIATCLAPTPVLLRDPEPLEPIPAPIIVTRYELVPVAQAPPISDDKPPTTDDSYDAGYRYTEWGWQGPYIGISGYGKPPPTKPPGSWVPTPHQPHDSIRAPEIDASTGASAVTILALALLIICDRRPRL